MNLLTGDVVLIHQHPFRWYNPITWVSAAIRSLCGTRYNHCGVIVNNWYEPFLNEAIISGVHSSPVAIRLHKADVLILRSNKFIIEEKFAVLANEYLGVTPYDFWSLFIVQPIYILFGTWIGKKDKSSSGKLYCSEYVALLYGEDKAYLKSPKDLKEDSNFSIIFHGILE